MAVDVAVSTMQRSPTAVVAVEPMDLTRFMTCFDSVYAFLRSGTDVEQVGQNIALYERGERMEVGVEVDRSFAAVGEVVSSHLPGGRVAHATHRTGYATLGDTYSAIDDYCAEHGLDQTGIQWEIYGDPDEHDHVDVEICFLLA